VEEHFYVALPLVLGLLIAIRPKSANPFRPIVPIFATLCVLALVLRLWRLWGGVTPEDHWQAREQTQYRFDGLLFGVILCYFATYHNARLKAVLSTGRCWQVATAVLLVTIPLSFNILTSYFANTVGYTMIYIGCGLFIIHIQSWSSPLKSRLLSALSPVNRIGVYSYSIYLWHQPVQHFVFAAVSHLSLSPGMSAAIGTVSYVAGSILLGAAMSKLIELPVLRLREKWFPSPSGDLPDLSSK
jgi:peptidoglycan/LPS O-acetylase OafA/YrhL